MTNYDDLIAAVSGPVRTPDDEHYDTERTGFQTFRPHSPDVIVGALDAADVVAAVRYARDEGLPVAVQSTGHGLAAAANGGVLVDTHRMTGIEIDPRRRIARIEAGARWKQVIVAAAEHGLAPLSGSSPEVGAVGYTLGGGFGLLAREFGFAADRVGSIDVVTPDGELRHVTAESDADLFWALRGGRDNFGVVTAIEMDLIPVTRVYGGGLYFSADQVSAVLQTYREWTDTVPDELSSAVALIPFPDIPVMPEPLRGKYVAHIRIAFTGSAEEGERLVAPLRAIGPRLLDTLEDMPYTESGSIYSDPPNPHAYTGDNALLSSLNSEQVDRIQELAGTDAVVEVRHLGGALSRTPLVPNAIGHRDAEYVVRIISVVDDDDIDTPRALHRKLLGALDDSRIGRNVNFVYRGDPEVDPVRDAYEPADYRRLTELKAVYDPTNMFRLNQNIPPAR